MPLDKPIPVLQPGVIYSADNGRLICVECAGGTAKFTGHDRSGQKVEPVPYLETVDWFEEFGKPMSCERGCTTYLLPVKKPKPR